MPLLRFAVRNEYGLGQPELYKDANKEDPKAVLDGVAVAGLVGILRQLGDLAEFAAEVFHGLQEQVMSTSSRSHKLTIRVQHLEAALPPLEKAVLAQTSHIHFAYTAGSEWHPHIRNEQNHFICNDLPRFVMDSYEECRNPPRMHLLDKFDAGGPGSCLNRYSDPAFFRRVSDSTIEKTAHRIQLEKKARKKKKRSSHRNGELSRVTSISNLNGREHFTSAGIIGRTSSQTAYTLDGTLKSDPGDHSMSFDLRPGSGYSECIFNRGSSLAPGEQGSKESSSMVRQQIDTPESSFCDESTHMVDDRQCSSSPERALPGSSCVTWDEKAEIVEPKGQRCDNVEVPEVLSSYFDVDRRDRGTARNQKVDEMDILLTREPVEALSGNLDIDTQEGINVHHRHADQMDILLDIESQEVLSAKSDIDTQDSETSILRNIDDMHIFPASKDAPTYLSNIDHANETESETDSYMDAVNTIESECENDLDCHMKCEVEQCSSSVDNCRVEDRIHEHVGHSSDQYPSSTESRTVADIPSTNGVSCNFPNSVPSGSSFHEQTPENFGKSSALDNSSGTDVCGNVVILDGLKVEPVTTDVQKVESVISDPSSSSATISNIRGQSGDRIKNGFPKHDELSSVTPVMFWTNGGLLGLEPSKPPDFALSNAGSLNDVVRNKSAPQDTIPKTDGLDGKLEALVENAESYEKFSGASFGKIPVSLADPDSKLEKSGASQINRSNHGSLYLTVVAASETELASDVKASPAEANQDCNSNSSIVFGLGHRFLTNGFHHRLSLAHDDNPIPVGSLSNGVFDRGSGHYHEAYQTVSETAFTERFGCGSPLGSLTSSPPLEHMKISFNPVYGSDTSKLKLKIPDGSRFPESGRDMFPSFQLVPERAIPLRGYGTDSDDDTFCRSSPYMSDDCPSHHSESNSEQWESSPGGSNDHDLYDDLCRMPPLESLSSTLQPERAGKHADRGVQKVATENGAEPGLPSFDLPSFDAARPALQEDLKTDCDPHNITELRNSKDPRPLPPPLPPMQWRVPKPLSDVAEDKQFSVPALRHELEEKLSVSTLSQQCELAVDRELTNKEAVAFTRESKLEDQPKLNGRKEVHQNANGKGVDEKEDFLHQIRTKSFSLRPTVTARSAFSSAPSANVKVTAILEKASAIRQAVASDDGEGDDTWSDT